MSPRRRRLRAGRAAGWLGAAGAAPAAGESHRKQQPGRQQQQQHRLNEPPCHRLPRSGWDRDWFAVARACRPRGGLRDRLVSRGARAHGGAHARGHCRAQPISPGATRRRWGWDAGADPRYDPGARVQPGARAAPAAGGAAGGTARRAGPRWCTPRVRAPICGDGIPRRRGGGQHQQQQQQQYQRGACTTAPARARARAGRRGLPQCRGGACRQRQRVWGHSERRWRPLLHGIALVGCEHAGVRHPLATGQQVAGTERVAERLAVAPGCRAGSHAGNSAARRQQWRHRRHCAGRPRRHAAIADRRVLPRSVSRTVSAQAGQVRWRQPGQRRPGWHRRARASSRNPFTEGSTVIVEPGTEEAPSSPGGDDWPPPAAGNSVAYHSNPLQLQQPRSSRPSLPSPAARTRHPASVSPSRAPALASSLRGLAGNSGGWPLVAASSFPPSLAPGSGGERGPSHPLTSSLRRQQPRLADGSARSSSPRVTGSDSLSPPPGHMVSLRALLSQGLTPRTAAGVVAPSGRGPADGGTAAGRADAPPLVVVSSPRDLSGSLSSRRRGGSPGVVVAASSPRQPPLDGTTLASSLASQQPLGSLSSRGSPPAHAHYYYHGDSEDDRVAAPRVQQAAGAALEDAPLYDLAQAAPPHLRGLLAAQQQHAADAQAAAAAAVAHAARQGHALLELAAAATAASSGAGGSGSGGSGGGFSPSSRSVRWGAATRAARPAAAADAAHGGGRAAPAAHES